MQQSAKISEFLKIVCEQIRWKKAHDVISEEIENHIIDQKNAFMAEGLDEETATDKAIIEMGDPVLIGSELDCTHRPKAEWSLILLTGIILMLGFAIRPFVTYELNIPSMLTFSIASAVLGIGCMIIAYLIDFTTIGKYSKLIFLGLFAATIVIMLATPIIRGRYIYAQYMILLFPTAFAGVIYSMRTKGYWGIVISGLLFSIPALITLLIPSLSGLMLYAVNCLILLTLAITKGWFNVNKLMAILLVYIPTVITSSIIFLVSILNEPYRLKRFLIFINPSSDPMGAGYIGTMTRKILANAKFYGKEDLAINPGNSLPNVNTDYILTFLIHRIGWISLIVIITLFLAFIVRSLVLCTKQKSVLGRLVATSVLITFAIQVLLYVANNLGLQLFSPLTLPLISYSGSATVIDMTLIGIMLSVFKSGSVVRDDLKTLTQREKKLIEIVDGKIIIDLK